MCLEHLGSKHQNYFYVMVGATESEIISEKKSPNSNLRGFESVLGEKNYI